MEDSANRYFLMMFLRNEEKIFLTKEEAKEFVREYNEKNRDSKNPEVGGELKTHHKSEPETWVVSYSMYKKITKKTTLKIIDDSITKIYEYEDEKSLKTQYPKEVNCGKGKLYIGYMYNGVVKILPIFYKEDKLFVDYEALTKFMIENANNQEFVASIWSSPRLKELKYKKNSIFYLNKLTTAYGKTLMNKGDLKEIEDLIEAFMKAWCTSDGEINQRLVREFGAIVKTALSKMDKKIVNKKELTKELTLF